jgi:hypothetical protein
MIGLDMSIKKQEFYKVINVKAGVYTLEECKANPELNAIVSELLNRRKARIISQFDACYNQINSIDVLQQIEPQQRN